VRKEAATRLDTSPAELSLYLQGDRTPSPDALQHFLSAGKDIEGDFRHRLDQVLVDAGYSPVFFKHFVASDDKLLILRRSGADGYEISEGTHSGPLLDTRFACTRAGGRLAALDSEKETRFFLLEPIYDDTDLNDGDVALFAQAGTLHFGRLSRANGEARFSPCDPQTMSTQSQQEVTWSEDVDLRARVVLQFTTPNPSQVRERRPAIKRLDKIRVGISPFQDSLLISAGSELGFFEEQGLVVQPESVDWYAWPTFFKESSAAIVFSNILTFVREFALREHDLPPLRFLYGVNLFDRGFALLSKHTGSFAQEKIIKIGTIAESDWAAQLYSLCRASGFDLSVKYAPSKEHYIYRHNEPIDSHKKIVLVDATRQLGVTNDAGTIDRTQSFYFGSLPQRFRLIHDHDWRIVEEMDIPGPYPVNGFVGTSAMHSEHPDVLSRFIRAWFRTINYLQPELTGSLGEVLPPHFASKLVQRAFGSSLFPENTAKLRITRKPYQNEIREAWQLERFPRTPAEVESSILGTPGSAERPWKQDAYRAIDYLERLFDEREPNPKWASLRDELNGKKTADGPAFLLEQVHGEYVRAYGNGRVVRRSPKELPLPEMLADLEAKAP
jgi:hypothetical protein